MTRETAVPILADLAIARRVELFDARAGVLWAEALARRAPELGVSVWTGPEAPGAVAVWSGPDSPLSRVLALGMAAPAGDEALDAIEALYRAHRANVRVELCPLAQATLAARLSARGYRLVEFEDVLVRALGSEDRALEAPAPGIEIHVASESERATWTRVCVEGFFGDHAPPGFGVQMEPVFDLADTIPLLLTVDGVPAAASAVGWLEGAASLFGMATLPAFRRRGAQSAMIAARLAHAARAGCDLATVGAKPGGDSHRNLERFGFRVLYTRAIVVLMFE